MHGPELRPFTAGRHTLVETRHNPGLAIVQRRGHRAEVMAIDAHVAVGQHDQLVPRHLEHVFEVGDLLIRPAGPRIDDEGYIAGREIANQRMGGRQRAILRVIDAEHDLQRRIILLRERAQIVIKARLVAVQRLQHRDGRLIRNYRRRAAGKTYDSHGRPDEIHPGRKQNDGDDKI